ncbi:MAG: hypothetical protein A2Y97_10250 [Nitrospirae bacterium RBG_13_39_12]|nr:MAG: hypothetical protein A2Y97_10250 [Nitrospirae bacterium RBG_13_39_12]
MEIKYDIPNLSDLSQLSHVFMYNRFFRGMGPSDYEAYALFMNYVRLVDIVLLEYESGRKKLKDFLAVKNDSLSTHLVVIAAGHFEMCVSTLKRVSTYLKRIRGHPKVAQALKNFLPRNLSVLDSRSEKLITDMRHAIEHLENRIQKGEITAGQSLCLVPTADALELGRHKMLFSDLSRWLKEVYDCSKVIAQYRET